jgi:hypothetical protein
MRRSIRTAIAAATVLAAAAPAARADIIAMATTLAPSSLADLDLARVDLSTSRLLSLPAGVNTSEKEDHASVSANGSRLVFERTLPTQRRQIDSSPPTSLNPRIVVTDLVTGKSTDAFTGDETVATPHSAPSITPDGKTVLTGGPDPTISGATTPAVTLTDISTFPAGPPYPQSLSTPGFDFGAGTSGLVEDPVATGTVPGSLIAYTDTLNANPAGLVFAAIGSPATTLNSTRFYYEHPAVGSPGGSPIVVFDQRPVSSTGEPTGSGDIVFRPANPVTFEGTPITIPGIDTSADETRPAFTPDGRYLGFIRVGTDGHERILVWDSQTQTILNAPGFDLGVLQGFADPGTLSLYQQFILRSTKISSTGTVSFNLASASGVGILVQRVVGHHQLFGQRVPTLRLVGRVPFGRFATGTRHVKWNLKVSGKRLRPGTYQVTVRAVTPKVQIRDLGTPHIIRLG